MNATVLTTVIVLLSLFVASATSLFCVHVMKMKTFLAHHVLAFVTGSYAFLALSLNQDFLLEHQKQISQLLPYMLSGITVIMEYKKGSLKNMHLVWKVSIASQLLWTVFTLVSANYGFLLLNVTLLFVFIRNYQITKPHSKQAQMWQHGK